MSHRNSENALRPVFVEQCAEFAALRDHFKVPAVRTIAVRAGTGAIRVTPVVAGISDPFGVLEEIAKLAE